MGLLVRVSTSALVILACAVPAAHATVRHAVPSGGAETGACAQAFRRARSRVRSKAAVSGDEVLVAGGGLRRRPAPLTARSGVSVRGADGARPRLLADLDSVGAVLTAEPGATVRHLYIWGAGKATDALRLEGGTAEDLVLWAEKGRAATVRRPGGTTVLRDSMLHAKDSSGRALQLVAGGLLDLGTIELRNLTVYHEDSASTAIYTSAGALAASMANVIARASGNGKDLDGAALSTIRVRNSNYRPWRSLGGLAVDLGGNQGARRCSSPTTTATSVRARLPDHRRGRARQPDRNRRPRRRRAWREARHRRLRVRRGERGRWRRR